MKIGMSELFQKINDLPTEEDRQNAMGIVAQDPIFVYTLKYIFNPEIKFDLPAGTPPYKENAALDSQGAYFTEFRKFYLFIIGGNELNLPAPKKQMMYIQMLETLDKNDAKLVIAMKDKICLYPNITYDLVYKTFPGLLPDPETLPAPFLKKLEQRPRKLPDGGHRCPFGCVSRNGNETYVMGPLVTHLKKTHKFSDDEIVEFKKGLLEEHE